MPMSPLPIDDYLSRIGEAVRSSTNLILTATPGAGKTTRLPPYLLQHIEGKILVLQPRRMAAVAAADRVAFERGWKMGVEVGYRVRFEAKAAASTRLVFMTDAMLLRQMIDDPELREVGVVVLDEFHERSLNQDIVLGCLRELQDLGRPIKLLIMSATLEVARLQEYLSAAQHIEVPGKVFPLEVHYAEQPLRLQTDRAFFERVVQAILAADTKGDILVFLPGTGEIKRVREQLEGAKIQREVMELHGSLSLSEQRRVLAPPNRARVVLATNVAEASVTVENVDYVIDSGLAKIMELNTQSGFSTLSLTRIAQFNARQRSGRAARQRPGVSLRLWTPHEEVTQAEQMVPEVQRTDLSQALLLLGHLGVTDFNGFAWLDHPPPAILQPAVLALQRLGAIDASHRLTPLGQRLNRLPLPPRWGVLLVMADERGLGKVGADLCAILNERDFIIKGATTNWECDVLYRLNALEDLQNGRHPGHVNSNLANQVIESTHQLKTMLQGKARSLGNAADEVRRLLLLSQRAYLCRRRPGSERGVMVGGRGVRLDSASQVRQSEFFVALNGVDLPGQPETLVSLACGMSKAFVLEHLGNWVEVKEEIEFVEQKDAFFSRRVRSIDGLTLEEAVLTPVAADLVHGRMAEVLFKRWDWLAKENEAIGRWLERWRFFTHFAPQFSEHLGEMQIRQVTELAAFGKTKMSEVVGENLVGILESCLDKNVLREFQQQVPEQFLAPSSVRHPIQYGDKSAAYVDVRLQEIFGLQSSPKLAFGKVPLTFRLLGPNFRPVQVTSDLANFWRVGYLEVRKELRARYPKHSWPDNPLEAKPEAKGRRKP